MSLGNGNSFSGDKGSNFNYELKSLQGLKALVDCCSTSGGTLLSILAALQNGQNFAQNLVLDEGGVGCPTNCPVYLEVLIWNGTSFDPPIYYDADGNLVVPVGPLSYLNPDYTLQQILTQITAINNDVDVALSTRLADATFTSRINTLGQKTSANSTPVVLPSDQVLNVNLGAGEMAYDAFGRLRVSNPLTLFDSSHRYHDNGLWNTSTASGGAAVFSANEGLVNLNVNTTSGSQVLRETTKVFSYQPGKSLLVFNTFVMAPAQTNLRQRVGYFGTDNGVYFQLNNSTLSFVERSIVTGIVTETVVSQSSWNVDKLNGTGPSGITLDITKAQILFADIEWLGEGTVRLGFIINGIFIVCHKFNHANLIASTYITTASLPLRYEITNTGTTANPSTLKQVCSTVISEGGYELRGAQLAIGTPITSPTSLATAGVYYPVISIKLGTGYLDAVVILTALSIMGVATGIYNWKVVAGGVTSGGSFVPASATSAVEYNITGTSFAGGRTLASGFLTSSAQSSVNLDILKEALFSFQLERDTFTNTPFEISLIVSASTNTELIYASMDWEEISR